MVGTGNAGLQRTPASAATRAAPPPPPVVCGAVGLHITDLLCGV